MRAVQRFFIFGTKAPRNRLLSTRWLTPYKYELAAARNLVTAPIFKKIPKGAPRMHAYKTPDKCHVALLCGGTSSEREISLESGKGAQAALLEAGFRVSVLDPARKSDLARLVQEHFDVAFLALHGKNGEDGAMQGMLEVLRIPYVGSGVEASALAMNKAKSKMVYEAARLQTPPFLAYQTLVDVSVEDVVNTTGCDCVIKACTEGSSNGLYIVHTEEEILEAARKAFQLSGEVVFEKYIPGNEYTVAVLGNNKLEALPVIQIVPAHEYYDFEAKYAPGGSDHLCPAPLSNELTQHMQDMAICAHRALGCRGVSRSDFIISEENEVYILETNTIPGMTKTSLLPDAARVKGYSFAQVAQRLVDLAFENHPPCEDQ